ncbi:NAD(P)-dependent oxidoreductase [uncultured Mycobacterium sp.]|uniref:NAD(P)-dependent oxidoreductase n=1 Tax=uncultured Mycobacterium sp. TaxID=171292 RepID=UPI0035CABF56
MLELLATGDLVSLHLPLTPDTEELLGRDALAWMRPDAVLVNAARGPHRRRTVDIMRRYLAEAAPNCRRLPDEQPLADVVNQPTGY